LDAQRNVIANQVYESPSWTYPRQSIFHPNALLGYAQPESAQVFIARIEACRAPP
jgi:hypothetical protein